MEAPLIRPHVPRHYGFREEDLLPFEEGSFLEVKVKREERGGEVRKEEWDVSGMRMDAAATRSRHSQKWTYFLPDGRRLLCTRSRCSSSTCVHLQRKVCPNQTFEWEALPSFSSFSSFAFASPSASSFAAPSSPTSLSAASLLASLSAKSHKEKEGKGVRGVRGAKGVSRVKEVKGVKGIQTKRQIASSEKSREKKSLYGKSSKKGKKGWKREEGMAFEPRMQKRERGVFC